MYIFGYLLYIYIGGGFMDKPNIRKLAKERFSIEVVSALRRLLFYKSDESLKKESLLKLTSLLSRKVYIEDLVELCSDYSEDLTEENAFEFLKEIQKRMLTDNVIGLDNMFFGLMLFKHFFDQDNFYREKDLLTLFMGIHCVDRLHLSYNEPLKYRKRLDKVKFNFSTFDILPDLTKNNKISFGPLGASEILNYFNYLKRHVEADDDYLLAIEYYSNGMYEFMEFMSESVFMDEYDKSLQNNTNFSSKEKYSNEIRRLVSLFYDGQLPSFSNKFMEFREIENKMMSVSDICDRKNMLFVACCYREYDANKEIFKEFLDIDLCLEDLVSFVEKTEEAGYILSTRQFKRLLDNFFIRFMEKNELLEIREKEVNIVKDEYHSFYLDNFAFTSREFIEYFNTKYQLLFNGFSFDGETTLLNDNIFESVFGNNIFLFSALSHTQAMKRYMASEVTPLIEDDVTEENLKQCKLEIFEKYYYLIEKYNNTEGETLNYFLRHNVESSYLYDIRELFEWHGAVTGIDYDNPINLLSTSKMFVDEFLEKIETSPFEDRMDILEEYKGYIESDGISCRVSEMDLANLLKKYSRSFSKQIREEFLARVNLAKAKGEDLYQSVSDMKLGSYAVEILRGHELFSEMEKSYKKYSASRNEASMGRKKEYVANSKKRVIEVFINSDMSDGIDEFFSSHGYSPSTMYAYAHSIRNSNPELFKSFLDKVNKCKNAINTNLDLNEKTTIIEGIINGVNFGNMTRKYTYFDLLMLVGKNISVSDVSRQILDKELYLNCCGDFCQEKFNKVSRFMDRYSKHFGHFNYDIDRISRHTITNSTYTSSFGGCISSEENNNILNFIEKNNFPYFVYYEAVDAKLRGEFDPSKDFKELSVQYRKRMFVEE